MIVRLGKVLLFGTIAAALVLAMAVVHRSIPARIRTHVVARSVAKPYRVGVVLRIVRPTGQRYQWFRCPVRIRHPQCRPIRGARHRSYRVQGADLGSQLYVRVLRGRQVHLSPPTGVIFGPLPKNIRPPQIIGNASEGSTLTADPGSWRYAVRLATLWQACSPRCLTVGSGPQLTLGQGEVGKTIRLIVTAYNYPAGV